MSLIKVSEHLEKIIISKMTKGFHIDHVKITTDDQKKIDNKNNISRNHHENVSGLIKNSFLNSIERGSTL